MNSKRLYFVLLAAIGLLLAALLAGTYNANKLLVKKADQLSTLKAQSLALSDERVNLKKAKQDIKKYDNLEKIVRTIVPEDKDQAEAVRELVNIAADNDVSLGAINFPASTLGAGPNGSPAAASSTIAPKSQGNSKTNALSQLLAVKNIPGVYLLQVTVQSDTSHPVRYDKFVTFLADLEHNRRTAQVNSINIVPVTENRNLLNFTLVLNTYIKP
jgi:hypothetical protein